MDLNKFTQKAREGLAAAQQLAAEIHHQEVTAKHLLAALIRQEDGLAGRFLTGAGADLPPSSGGWMNCCARSRRSTAPRARCTLAPGWPGCWPGRRRKRHP